MPDPVIQAGEEGSNIAWTEVWSDEFEGDALDTTRWRYETLAEDSNGSLNQAAQHVVNNRGIDYLGNVDPARTYDGNGNVQSNIFAKGKRHAAWYDKYRDDVHEVSGGNLHMKLKRVFEPDPTITRTYFDPDENQTIDLRNQKLYCSWIDTNALIFDSVQGKQIPDPNGPRQWWRYGFFEWELDFTGVVTPGARVSVWLLPAVDEAGEALIGTTYNDDPADGLETDVFEYEAGNSDQLLLMKNIGGGAGSDPAVNAASFGFDMRSGKHKMGLLWDSGKMVWYLNGVETKRDEVHVPRIAMAMYITREMNTGVKLTSAGDFNVSQDPPADPPFIQQDPGLYARNIGAHTDTIDNDVALVSYARVWQDMSRNDNIISPYDMGLDGSDPTTTPVTPTPTTPTTTEQKDPYIPPQPSMVNGKTYRVALEFRNNDKPEDFDYEWSSDAGINIQGATDQHFVDVMGDGVANESTDTRQLYVNAVRKEAAVVFTDPILLGANGVLTSTSNTFNWFNSVPKPNVSYELFINSTSQGTTSGTSLEINGLPSDGSTLTVRLDSTSEGVTVSTSVTMTASTTAPSIISITASGGFTTDPADQVTPPSIISITATGGFVNA